MKKVLIIFVLIFSKHIRAQNLADTIPITKNAISIELIGSSCNIFSVHFNRIIKKTTKCFYSIDAGFGYMPDVSKNNINSVMGSSIALDWNNRLYKKNHIVGGIGVSYSDGLFQYGFPDEEKKSHKVLYGSLRLGYKFQKTTKGLFFNLLATPIFKFYEFSALPSSAPSVFPLLGVGIGYSF